MRANIFEKTTDNMNVLRDCVDMIIGSLPRRFKADDLLTLEGYDLRGLQKLREKYKETPYGPVLEALGKHTFAFSTSRIGVKNSVMGAYHARPVMRLWINVSGLMQSADERTLEDVLAQRMDDRPIKSFRAILLHELRHLFQSYLYERYFHREPSVPYQKQPVEIDAAWNHHLEDYDPKDYASVSAYVDAVMASFANYKTLTDQQVTHYRRKTARYFFERTSPSSVDRLALPAKERLVLTRDGLAKWVGEALAGLSARDYNLKDLPGYDPAASRFFLPSRTIGATAAMIGSHKVISPTAAPIAFLVLSLVTPPHKKDAVLKHLRGVQKITLEDALAGAEHSFAGGFDVEALKTQIKRVFG